jgi:hypothetical protein
MEKGRKGEKKGERIKGEREKSKKNKDKEASKHNK